MLNHFKILTITHHQTPLKDLGKFVIADAEGSALQQHLESLKIEFNLDELMYLATCNRVMYFFYTGQTLDNVFNYHFFKTINPGLEPDFIQQNVKIFEGHSALEHLYKVAASVDSMVVGEREILRQMREAYARSKNWQLTGDNLRIAFQSAVNLAKEVYDKTRIGEKPVSVVSLAIQKLRDYCLPKDARILLIGAGQTNTLVGKFLRKHQYENVTVFNRTFEKAEKLADLVNGAAFPIQYLKDYKKGFDCLIVCTGATSAIVDISLYERLLQGEDSEKLVIDLAIPNNVSKEVQQLSKVQYVEIEDLRQMAQQNLSFRKAEVKKAKKLIQKQLQTFETTYQQRQIARAMRRVPEQIKAVKAHAMNNVFKKEVEQLDEASLALLNKMMSYMERRCISIPMQAAKEMVS